MSKTTQPLHKLYLSTVAMVTGLDQQSVENAAFAAKLATKGDIPADKLPESLQATDKQLSELIAGDGNFVEECHHHLTRAKAGVTAQIEVYRLMFTGGDPATGFMQDGDVTRSGPETQPPLGPRAAGADNDRRFHSAAK